MDLMSLSIRLAGFELRDSIGWAHDSGSAPLMAWTFGSGFPKSLDVGKSLDAAEKKRWLDVRKAIDNADQSAMLATWKEYSKTASSAGVSFAKSETANGTNMPKSGFVPESVLLQADPENSDAVALVAGLSLIESCHTSEAETSSVARLADENESPSPVRSAESQRQSGQASNTHTGTVRCDVKHWQSESTADKLKAVEALKTWLGSKPSSKREDTVALCAALTADLKLITLSQSKTFQSFDTTRQMACASAISVTITEFMAASLISFTADTLRNKAIDKAAEAEREVVGQRRQRANNQQNSNAAMNASAGDVELLTIPATDAARQWAGWGTALKPAWEPIIIARKPIDGGVADNLLLHGTGGLNIDACRVEAEDQEALTAARLGYAGKTDNGTFNACKTIVPSMTPGRWPANIIIDDSDAVKDCFPITTTRAGAVVRNNKKGPFQGGRTYTGKRTYTLSSTPAQETRGYADHGTAARFFYCAKASRHDRDEGCEELPSRVAGGMQGRHDGSMGSITISRNHHPTVKPTTLMRYLCRLITPPGGVVLDPFCGSGSTGRGAVLEGFRFIGIERELEYVEIARARIAHAIKQVEEKDQEQEKLF
jgi:site-specific DNA-methyltransferase (adenine-specific)